MIGLMHKVLFDLIKNIRSEEVVEQVVKDANLDPDYSFRIDTVYSDEEWHRILSSTCKVLDVSRSEVISAYAKHFLQDALNRFPVWFKMAKNSKQFLELQPAVHNCFAQGQTDMTVRNRIENKFLVEKSPNGIITHYKSNNKFCDLYKFLAEEVIAYYGDVAVINETKCMHGGEEECEIRISWGSLKVNL